MSLSPRQRVLNAIRRDTVDCIPAAPYMYDVAAEVTGTKLLDYYTDASIMAQAQLRLHELVGHDVISVGADNYYIAEGFGCRTTRNDDELPSLLESPISSLTQLDEIQVPDPKTDGRMPVMLQAIRLVRQAVGDQIAIRSPGTGPFALASYLIGSQNWLMEVGMLEAGMNDANEPLIHRALELSSEALIRFGIACWDAGADVIHCGDSLASCDVISPQTYRRLAMPYQQRVFAAWRAHGVTGSLLHICGDSTQVLDDYADTGADLLEIDNKVDLAEAKRRIGHRVALQGNVHTVEHLLKGSPETVREAANQCILAAGDRGFILGSGCIVPRRAPLQNIQAMVQAAHQHAV